METALYQNIQGNWEPVAGFCTGIGIGREGGSVYKNNTASKKKGNTSLDYCCSD